MTDIWGFHKAPAIVKVHLNFCKKVLGVNKRINNNMVYCELGRHPLYIRRKFKDFFFFRYWSKIKTTCTNNCILKECYENNNDIWIVNIKDELSSQG